MKPAKRIAAAIALPLIAASALISALSLGRTATKTQGSDVTLSPALSDGITLEDADLSIKADTSNGVITFRETKVLAFRAAFADGWSFCPDYSIFFPDDERASIADSGDGSVVFSFRAISGEKVGEEEFSSVWINASAEALPRLEIAAHAELSDIGKDEWVGARFTLTLGTKQFESGDYLGSGYIKGRGNSSWANPQKPYSIKLGLSASLLDIPATKKYAVIPSYVDPSLMRNFITYKSALLLSGIEYSPKCEFVEVYLNGKYNGIYLLVERIDIENTKIDIEEASANDITGGYIIEKDCRAKLNPKEDVWFDCPYWANQSRDCFTIKAPDIEDKALLGEMLDYLEGHMWKVHNAVMGTSGESYTQYIDADSWIDFIIMQELSKNIDGNFKTSCYIYKLSGDDKLYIAALWDFDYAYGYYPYSNASAEHNDADDCPPGDTCEGFMTINSSAPWILQLYYGSPEFREALMIRYNEYRETLIPAMRVMIYEQAAYLLPSAGSNDELWGKNFTRGVNRLASWLDGRIAWLDSQWLTDPETADAPLPGSSGRGSAL